MKVINIHKRSINQPKRELEKLFATLATDNDRVLANNKWPPMKLNKGLQVGSRGGHGPMQYIVSDYQEGNSITFQFDMKGFNGFHRLELLELGYDKTEISHIIDMTTSGLATVRWVLVIRWLHDAFVEDAFDKVENEFLQYPKVSRWNWWVIILRKVSRPRRYKK